MDGAIYTTTEIADISGFSVRQLDYWARDGLIVPSYQQACGSGSRRLYTMDDLVVLNFIRQLKKYGWSTQKIRKAIITLKEVMNDPNPLKSAVLIHGKETIFALSKTREGERILIDALSIPGQLVMNFVLEILIEEAYCLAYGADEGSSRVILQEVQVGGQNVCH